MPSEPTFQPWPSSSDFDFSGSYWLNFSTPFSYHLKFGFRGPYVATACPKKTDLTMPSRSMACEIACRTSTWSNPSRVIAQLSAINEFEVDAHSWTIRLEFAFKRATSWPAGFLTAITVPASISLARLAGSVIGTHCTLSTYALPLLSRKGMTVPA